MFQRVPLPGPSFGSLHQYVLERETLHNGSHLFKFSVIGKGEFPFDMLRCDTYYPADSTSAAQLNQYYTTPHNLRQVHLLCRSLNINWQPTFDRWRSFGWVVATTAWEGREVA